MYRGRVVSYRVCKRFRYVNRDMWKKVGEALMRDANAYIELGGTIW